MPLYRCLWWFLTFITSAPLSILNNFFQRIFLEHLAETEFKREIIKEWYLIRDWQYKNVFFFFFFFAWWASIVLNSSRLLFLLGTSVKTHFPNWILAEPPRRISPLYLERISFSLFVITLISPSIKPAKSNALERVKRSLSPLLYYGN